MWIKANRTEATFPEVSWPRAAQRRNWKGTQHSERKREPLSLLFTSATLPLFIPGSQSGPARPALHPVSWGSIFPSPTTDMKSGGLPAWGRGLRGCGREVCEPVHVCTSFKKRVANSRVCTCMVVGCRGAPGQRFTGSSRHKPWDSGATWPLLSPHLPPSLPPPSTLVLRNAGCTFLQEMKRSSVQKASEGLVSPFSLPQFPSLYGKEGEGVGVEQALAELLKCGRLR